ncbi:DNA methyltransferase [Enteroscipio rubneri]|uniref:DNA methylase N-4/N-6 domain-containing protein n=1 Tax=Enteroscipio rubneri TaxID=2070686 RepID=A0A2K2U8R1_9ACTN|nr:DNA methyltransferase [Enteroscipio rubneri]PNV66715.1 hypothetical protein C2L71_11720 [Enteroscipio rubneri]
MRKILDGTGLVHFGDDESTAPNNKTYLRNTENQSLTSMIYQDGRSASKRLERLFGQKVFSNPKDENVLIKLFSAFGLKEGDIVLDFFSGSGTTGDAVEKYSMAAGKKVRWLLVQLPESLEDNLRTAVGSNKKITKNAIDYLVARGLEPSLTSLAEERLRLDWEQIEEDLVNRNSSLFDGADSGVDAGFRVFVLDESGITKPAPGQLVLDRIKPNYSDEDIIFEMMLKWGLELTYPIEKTEINGYACYSIAGDALICCMRPGLTVQTLNEIAELEPDRVLMLDSILDDTLKLNALQIFKRVEERTQKKIDLRTV